jgi:Uma2 family endonuclease
MSTNVIEDLSKGSTAVFAPITVQQYHAMISAGILLEGAPIELIDGLLVQKDRRDKVGAITKVGPRHATTVQKLPRALDGAVAGHPYHARSQQPVTLSGLGEPEPDAALVSGTPDDYAGRHPGPADARLVAEVADSSLAYDRTTKQRVYAVACIPLYWIVNLQDNVIEVYETPLPDHGCYQTRVDYRVGDVIAFRVDGREFRLDVCDILG